MSLRARIFIIVSIIALFILGVSMLLIVRSKNKTNLPQTIVPADNTGAVGNGQTVGQVATGTVIPDGLPAKTPTPLEAEKNGATQLAKVFVERYGTYSTDNNFQNIREVETFVSRSLWSKISAPMLQRSASMDVTLRDSVESKTTTQSFVGMTTKVISMELVSWSDTKATIELKTTRTEEKNGVVSAHYQNATVEMVKVNSSWLVDGLVWN